MKISWGSGLLLTYLAFMAIILSAVFFSFTQDVNLVSDNYYERELTHQQEIDKAKRADVLSEKVLFLQTDSSLVISFPNIFGSNKIKGKVRFYRPDDNQEDFEKTIVLNDSFQQEVLLTSLKKGLWKISVDWFVNDVSYLSTKNLMVD